MCCVEQVFLEIQFTISAVQYSKDSHSEFSTFEIVKGSFSEHTKQLGNSLIAKYLVPTTLFQITYNQNFVVLLLFLLLLLLFYDRKRLFFALWVKEGRHFSEIFLCFRSEPNSRNLPPVHSRSLPFHLYSLINELVRMKTASRKRLNKLEQSKKFG